MTLMRNTALHIVSSHVELGRQKERPYAKEHIDVEANPLNFLNNER